MEQSKVNPFASAKKKETAAKKDEAPLFMIPELEDALKQFHEAKHQLTIFEAQKKMSQGIIMETARLKFLEIVQKDKRRLTSFKVAAENVAPVLFILQDKYPSLDRAGMEAINDRFPGIVKEKKTYTFNAELLEKHIDKIAEALMTADIPEDAKAELLEVKEEFYVDKGTIDRLPTYGEHAASLLDAIRPQAMLK